MKKKMLRKLLNASNDKIEKEVTNKFKDKVIDNCKPKKEKGVKKCGK